MIAATFAGDADSGSKGTQDHAAAITAPPPPDHTTETWLAGDGLLGRLLLRDELRPQARELVARLAADGVRTVMLTGDRASAAERMARESGVAEVREGEALGIGTFGVFIGMLIVYKTGAVRVTPRFQRWMIGALVGVLVLVLVRFVSEAFFGDALGMGDGGFLSIVISLVIIGVAAFSLLLDFDMADQAIRAGVGSRFGWYIAFGLMTTLVWLYIEILRIIAIFRSN